MSAAARGDPPRGERLPLSIRGGGSTMGRMDAPTVIVALSGGVDSAVAAYLLREAGERVAAVYMDAGPPRPARPDALDADASGAVDARRVADALGIPLTVADLRADFDDLIAYVCAEYGRGRTPNPCVVCNRRIKFARLLERADALGAARVATGHYARVEWEAGRWRLKRARDRAKDQSYFLFGLEPSRLERVRLPLGEMTKAEVRRLARDLGLPVHDRPESQDVCFVAGSLGNLVRAHRPDLVRPGPILDTEGRELGRHEGIVDFTVGQRRGLGVAVGEPRYVVAIRPQENAVVVGPAEATRARGLTAEGVVWHERPPAEPVRAEVQIRYRHPAAPAWLTRLDDARPDETGRGTSEGAKARPDKTGRGTGEGGEGRAEVRFDEPQSAPAPGQAAVFYRDDRVLGGGWIGETVG